MRPYEVMFILDAGLEEDAIQAVVDRATDLISKDGGSANRVDHWGRRRLAYEIEHRSEGYYVLIEATAEPAVVTELDRMLSLSDEVMRHKVIRIPDEAAAKAVRRRPEAASRASEVPQPVGGEHA
ncbi:MAG TPA: 30S ribosomal protein S6 [Acidimicrobiales bacterium]|nr:30S ribosomal protein S6 [Acidimicrobiales bacterium]